MRYARGEMRGTPADQMIATTPAVSMIGTDPTEWSTNRAQIVQAADMQGQTSRDAGMQTVPTDPQAWSEGDLGWVIDQPRLRLPGGAEMQMRVTTIVHREGGTWKVVHQHASIGVPNDSIEVFRGH
jgi:ketosteroid isomerase-like protein